MMFDSSVMRTDMHCYAVIYMLMIIGIYAFTHVVAGSIVFPCVRLSVRAYVPNNLC